MMGNEYLEILRQNPEFLNLLKRVNEHRPIIPLHNMDPDNTESWKANSYMQRGFDLALSLLGENNE